MSITAPSNLLIYGLLAASVPSVRAYSVAVDAVRDIGLFGRATDVCGGDTTLSQCGSGFPSSFCCSTSSECIALNDNNGSTSTTTICCPSGASCQVIRPITCDTSEQNATARPGNAVHTTNLTATLESCGGLCCPLGYNCTGGDCQMLQGAVIPTTTASSSTSIPTSASTSSQTGATTTSPASSTGSSSSNKIGAGTIAGIVIGCVAFGVFLAIFCVYHFRRRAIKKRQRARHSGDFGPVTRKVGDPIYNHTVARTDFLSKTSPGRDLGTELEESPTSQNMPASQRAQAAPRAPPPKMNLPMPLPTAERKPRIHIPFSPRIRSFVSRSPRDTFYDLRPGTPTSAPRHVRQERQEQPQTYAPASPSAHAESSKRDSGNSVVSKQKTASTETIDVVMSPPREPGFAMGRFLGAERDGRSESTYTTFSEMLAGAGFGRGSRADLRDFGRKGERGGRGD